MNRETPALFNQNIGVWRESTFMPKQFFFQKSSDVKKGGLISGAGSRGGTPPPPKPPPPELHPPPVLLPLVLFLMLLKLFTNKSQLLPWFIFCGFSANIQHWVSKKGCKYQFWILCTVIHILFSARGEVFIEVGQTLISCITSWTMHLLKSY